MQRRDDGHPVGVRQDSLDDPGIEECGQLLPCHADGYRRLARGTRPLSVDLAPTAASQMNFVPSSTPFREATGARCMGCLRTKGESWTK